MQLIGLWANIPRLKAQRILDAPPFSNERVTMNRLYDLVLLATGDAKAAERQAKAYRAAELRAGVTPQE